MKRKISLGVIICIAFITLIVNIANAQTFTRRQTLGDPSSPAAYGWYCIEGGGVLEDQHWIDLGGGGTNPPGPGDVLANVVNDFTNAGSHSISSSCDRPINERKMAYVLYHDTSGYANRRWCTRIYLE